MMRTHAVSVVGVLALLALAASACTKFGTPVDAAADAAADHLDGVSADADTDRINDDVGAEAGLCIPASTVECPFSLTSGRRCVGSTLYSCTTHADGCVSATM